MDTQLLALLVCPICKGPVHLSKNRQMLICRADKLGYPIRDDIPVMLETQAHIFSTDELEHEAN